MYVNNTSTNRNKTNAGHEHQSGPGFILETHLVIVMMGVLIVVFNGTVLYLVKTKRSLRTATNYFLASLAVSDLITGLYTIPTYLACSATYRNDLCQANVPIFVFTSISTVSHIVIVTIDRYIFIMYSLSYSAIVTKERSWVAIAVTWIYSSSVALVQLVWAVPGEVDVLDEGSEEFNRSEKIFSTAMLVLIIVPFTWVAFAYGRIFVQVRRQNRFIRNHVAPGAERPKTHELRTVSAFLLMLFAYLFCWMPNAVIRFQYSTSSFHLPEWAEVVIIHLRFLTSVFNPLIYVFGKQDFRSFVHCCHMKKSTNGSPNECSSTPRSANTNTTMELKLSVNQGLSESPTNSVSGV